MSPAFYSHQFFLAQFGGALFGEITRKRIRRGVFKSVKKLIAAIQNYIKINNQNPKPFVWTKRVEEILEKVNHCKASTVTPH